MFFATEAPVKTKNLESPGRALVAMETKEYGLVASLQAFTSFQ